MDDLVALVETLGRTLNRSVALSDAELRLIAYNRFSAGVDGLRTRVILGREASSASKAWAKQLRVAGETEPRWLPPNPELDADARLLIPLRWGRQLVGYLWVLDPDRSLSDEQIATCRRAAEPLTAAMRQDWLRRRTESTLVVSALQQLIAGRDEAVRSTAAADLIEHGAIAAAPAVGVLVVEDVGDGGQERGDRAAVVELVERQRLRLLPRHSLLLQRIDHLVLLVVGEQLDVRRQLEMLPAALIETARDAAGRDLVVGRSVCHEQLASAAAAYEQARIAASVARRVEAFAPASAWDQLGIFRWLVPLAGDEAMRTAMIPPRLAALLAAPTAESAELLRTLACYLDNAGEVQKTAAALSLHRATLHQRLRRVERLLGADLHDGTERLALHVGLKLHALRPGGADGRHVLPGVARQAPDVDSLRALRRRTYASGVRR